MEPEELDKELERLWAKVGSASGGSEPVPLEPSAFQHQAAFDAVAILKRKHRQQELEWAGMLDSRERAYEELRSRAQALDEEVRRLRDERAGLEARRLDDILQLETRLDAGAQAVEAESRRMERERRALEEVLEATRARLAEESSRLRSERELWEKREEQYLRDLQEVSADARRSQEEASRQEEGSRRLADAIRQAQGSLEAALAELKREREIRKDSEEERDRAAKKAEDVERHLGELSRLWDEERAQWRELWDRERSTWEAQRREFADWEESLRSEREAWHAKLQAQEGQHAAFMDSVQRTLRESAETASRVGRALKILAGLGAAAGTGAERSAGVLRRAAPAAALAAALAFAAWGAARWWTRPRLERIAVHALSVANPTGLAYDGALLWVSDYGGRLRAFDPADPSRAAREAAVSGLDPYRPAALAWAAGDLWSLDAAQARLIRHKAASPGEALSARAAPGPAPVALAFDGRELWSYDAANQALYRHGPDGGLAQTHALEEDVLPGAMAWVGGRLWIFDSKSRDALVYDRVEQRLRLRGRLALGESVLGAAPAPAGAKGQEIWLLAGPSADRPGHALIRYSH